MGGFVYDLTPGVEKMSQSPKEKEREEGQRSLETYLSKARGQEPAAIIVDYRERGSQIVLELEKLGVLLEFKSLKVGDYIISERLAIERKSFEDFICSIIDRRLFDQARSLKEAYSRPVILLEGKGPTKRCVSEEALRGALVSVILDFEIPIIWAENAGDGARYLLTMVRREKIGGPREISLKDRKRPTTPDEEKEYIVASLPLVESATAKKLLNAFKTVEGVFTADEKGLMEIEGIGKKKAARIRKTIASGYGVKPSSDEPSQECQKATRAS